MKKIFLTFCFLCMASTSFAALDESLKEAVYKDAAPIIQATIDNDIEKVRDHLKNGDSANQRCKYMHAPVLLYAVENDNLEIAKLLLENGANPDASYDFEGGPTILMSARAKMAELLISYGAEVDYYVVEGENPFGSAVRRGDIETMKVFLKHGVKPQLSSIMDEGSANSDYALASFIQGANSTSYFGTNEDELIEVLKFLISLGADIHANIEHYNNPSQSLLMYMAESNSTKIMQFLIDNGVDINAKDFEGRTALDYALREGNSRAADYLLERNAQISVHNDVLMPLAKDGNIEKIQFFLDKSADVNAKDKDGDTALHYALRYGELDTIKFLLSKGADVNARNNDNDTPLIYICYELSKVRESKLIECIDILLKSGADINAQGDRGFTVLMNMMKLKVYKENYDEYAVPSLKAMQFLIDNGADINLKNEKGYNILFYALSYAGYVYKGRILPNEVIEFFFKNGLDAQAVDNLGDTALFLALNEHKKDTIQLLLDKGIDVNAKNKLGNTALIQVSRSDFVNVAILAKYKADINAKDNKGEGILFKAASFNIERLLQVKGIDLNTRDEHGHTPLMIPNPRVQEELIKAGADVNAVNSYNQTALMIAAYVGIEEIVKLLVDNGADKNIKDENDSTALDYAKSQGHQEIIQLLENAR